MTSITDPITDNTLDVRIKEALEAPGSRWRTVKGIAEQAQVPAAVVEDYIARNPEKFDQTLLAGVPVYAFSTGQRHWISSSVAEQRKPVPDVLDNDDTSADQVNLVAPSPKRKLTSITIQADFNELDADEIRRLLEILRTVSGDTELNIRSVKSG